VNKQRIHGFSARRAIWTKHSKVAAERSSCRVRSHCSSLASPYSPGIAGHTAEAEDILQSLLSKEETAAIHIALVQIGLGAHDNAVGWLERAFEARQSHLLYIKQDAMFDPLRGDPRFEALIRRIGW